MKLQISKLFEQIHSVPQVPEVVRILISQLNDPNTVFNDISKNIEKEQMLSMKVLRLVNSAHFGLSQKVGSIDNAVSMLGMEKLKTLVIASGIVNSVPDIPNFDISTFWAESFCTATYAKWLAEEIKIGDSDMIFTAGLISGLGTILLHLGAPKAANEVQQHVNAGENRYEYEQKRLSFSSQEVSAELCNRWHFSEDLVNTVSQSGKPLLADKISLPACIVYIARYISESNHSEISEEKRLINFPNKEWQQLGLNTDDIAIKLSEIMEIKSGLEGLAD
ncbi:MAG: HDOD domain-containing protein [Methylococcales bacterium]|nr:HDOD domain-containing protein [Methylococcales bacterium]